MKTILMILLLSFEPPDTSCSMTIQIVNSRFDNLYDEVKIDTCCFVNRINPNITWVVYKDKEVPYNTNTYTIIILPKEKK